ncbi:phage holin family protein [Prochlorococcus marinus]|uniref:phage holin family protein n=1 Tax=Prochlorococcus marinus TaxID=1219 RepID=UPI0022B57B1D|nr:phage holin family protein [Prochlorococcus marinus]
MTNSERKKGIGAAARVTALASSVMDLHVRIALQEMDREKRRLISGAIFLATGGVLMLFALLGSELILGYWLRDLLEIDNKSTILILVFINLALAGMSLRIGGYLAKGPYLPETLEGITKTTRAVLGKN